MARYKATAFSERKRIMLRRSILRRPGTKQRSEEERNEALSLSALRGAGWRSIDPASACGHIGVDG